MRIFSPLLYEPDDALRKRWESDDLVIYQANPVAVNNAEVFQSIKDLRGMAILYEIQAGELPLQALQHHVQGPGAWRATSTSRKSCGAGRKKTCPSGRGRRVWLGLDLAQSDDNTAVSMVTVEGDVLYAKVWGFIPKGRHGDQDRQRGRWTING